MPADGNVLLIALAAAILRASTGAAPILTGAAPIPCETGLTAGTTLAVS
jgi:hypothetical protein